MTRNITRSSNRNGNAGRPYYKCFGRCNKFVCFDDMKGVYACNPPCHCGKPSRMQVAGIDRNPPGGIHYVCIRGNCRFYALRIGEDNSQLTVPEDLIPEFNRLMIRDKSTQA